MPADTANADNPVIETPIKRINHLRRLIWVHSVIYYQFGDSIVTDEQWNAWARELAEMQETYKDLLPSCWRSDIFASFSPCSGYYLPLQDPWALEKARWLVLWRRKHEREI